ncbi:glycosyltransferase family 2 protein [Pedobacter sp. UBA5917]|uniref:glycosyltransferase family 2 protein n=1 Tax=Pedobacter sp. UBA5917 TaxID=1947061 RepID=UPI0025DDAC06|nr:glycosyltransferase family 2 protein [Pedobacter sp. UBA5917]
MFSIIIPTYNSSETLKKCLESILNQTFEDFEVLIMDGNSTDTTVQIAKSYANDKIKIFSENDCGVYEAMNKGIKSAKGEWLYFLGSDDELYEDLILKKIACLSKGNSKIIYGNVMVDQDAGWAKNGQVYDGIFNKEKIIRNNICHQSIFYHKDVFTSIGHYNLRYPINADHDFNIRACALFEFQYIDLIVAKFKGGGLSSNPDVLFKTDFDNIVIDNHLIFLHKLRLSNKKILKRAIYNFVTLKPITAARILIILIKKHLKINLPPHKQQIQNNLAPPKNLDQK